MRNKELAKWLKEKKLSYNEVADLVGMKSPNFGYSMVNGFSKNWIQKAQRAFKDLGFTGFLVPSGKAYKNPEELRGFNPFTRPNNPKAEKNPLVEAETEVEAEIGHFNVNIQHFDLQIPTDPMEMEFRVRHMMLSELITKHSIELSKRNVPVKAVIDSTASMHDYFRTLKICGTTEEDFALEVSETHLKLIKLKEKLTNGELDPLKVLLLTKF